MSVGSDQICSGRVRSSRVGSGRGSRHVGLDGVFESC